MSDAIAQIGQLFSGAGLQNLLKVGEIGAAGAGLFGNIQNEKARSNQLSQIASSEKTLADPTALAKQVSAATQPLNSGLVQSVTNSVDANAASQGLSQAPGIQAAELSQALAPFQQQNQNTALQLVLQRLGLPLQYAQTFLSGLPQNSNLAPLLALLQRQNNPSSTSGGGGGLGSFDFLNLISPQAGTAPASTDLGDFQLPNDIYA